eukprot:gene40649-48842_t
MAQRGAPRVPFRAVTTLRFDWFVRGADDAWIDLTNLRASRVWRRRRPGAGPFCEK